MQQAESEDENDAPRLQLGGHQVLHRHVGDGERDERLDDRRRQREHPVDGQGQGDRVGGCERRYLEKERPEFRAQQEQAEHEEDVVEALGQDVREAEAEVLDRYLQAGKRHEVRDVDRGAELARLQPAGQRCARRRRDGQREFVDNPVVGELEPAGAGRDGSGEPNQARFGQPPRAGAVERRRRNVGHAVRRDRRPVEDEGHAGREGGCELRQLTVPHADLGQVGGSGGGVELQPQPVGVVEDVDAVGVVRLEHDEHVRVLDVVGGRRCRQEQRQERAGREMRRRWPPEWAGPHGQEL